MIKKTICISNPAYLKVKDHQLIVSNPDPNIPEGKVPIEDIGFLILENPQITISHPLIGELLDNNVGLITCNQQFLPTGLMLNLAGNSVQTERFKAQIEASIPLKKQLWQLTIKAKIENQQKVLEAFGFDSKYLQHCKNGVKSGDSDNHEAMASHFYWKTLFREEDDMFRRDRDGIPPNHLLNYGYSILRSVIARALTGSGLLPTLGIFHRNKYNAYCLADDIMEPYRPYVDFIVKKQFSLDLDNSNTMTKEQKLQLLQIPVLDVSINGEQKPLMIAAQNTTASLAKCFLGESKFIAFPTFHSN